MTNDPYTFPQHTQFVPPQPPIKVTWDKRSWETPLTIFLWVAIVVFVLSFLAAIATA